MTRTTLPSSNLSRSLLALTIPGCLFLAPLAHAHHPMGGATPETFTQGLLSGFGHPIIGIRLPAGAQPVDIRFIARVKGQDHQYPNLRSALVSLVQCFWTRTKSFKKTLLSSMASILARRASIISRRFTT